MSTAIYTHAENAEFLADLAGQLANTGTWPQEQIDRLNDLAANEAEQDPAYVSYVNAKVRAALANPGRMLTEAEMDAQIASW
ncbi:hypothetical protein [Thauera butanivorans]|uniref:hypothetical protein n=1 Tax=Thauera butanivorans TaxID=86174 RepID=UPI000838AE06|nr:hypothetical protein [Thauera butanivorans]